MTYRYIDNEKIEQRRRKSTRTSGVFSIVISLLFIACGIFFLVALESAIGMLVMLIFALLFIAGGIYFFNQIKIEEKRSRALDDPNSRAYQKKQRSLAKEREKYLHKAKHHGSLKSILCRRAALIWGISTLVAWLVSVLLLLAGVIVFILGILDVVLPIVFLSSLLGKDYKSILNAYAEYGVDRSEAESDFAESRAYLVTTDVIAVSSHFLIASGESIVLPVEHIVWIYSGYDNIHHYNSGMYSHTERKYCVIVGLSDGEQVKISCPEELCSVIMDDVVREGISVTAGYSDELQELFDTAPDAFRNAVKTEMYITMNPIGPIAQS